MTDTTSGPGESIDPTTDDADEREGLGFRIVTVVIAVVFGLLYAYVLFEAIGNLVNLPGFYSANGIADSIPWWALIVGVLVPPLFFLFAFLLGRRRPVFARVLIFAAGLGATNAVFLSLVATVLTLQPAIN